MAAVDRNSPCKSALESALRPLAGVKTVQLDIKDKTTTVDFDNEVIDRNGSKSTLDTCGVRREMLMHEGMRERRPR